MYAFSIYLKSALCVAFTSLSDNTTPRHDSQGEGGNLWWRLSRTSRVSLLMAGDHLIMYCSLSKSRGKPHFNSIKRNYFSYYVYFYLVSSVELSIQPHPRLNSPHNPSMQIPPPLRPLAIKKLKIKIKFSFSLIFNF